MKWMLLLFVIVPWCAGSEYSDGSVALYYSCVSPVTTDSHLPPILLMHGFMLNTTSWNGIYEVLTMQTNRKVCMLDARNHGRSPYPEEFSFDLMVADTVRVLDDLNATQGLLVGHSMGGNTAMRTALNFPHRIEKIVVEDMRPISSEPESTTRVNYTYQVMKRCLDFVPEGVSDQEDTEAFMDYVRKALEETLEWQMNETDLQWLSSMIVCESGKCRYNVDVDFVIRFALDTNTDIVFNGTYYEGDALFVYGQLSDFKVGEAEEEIRPLFPKAQLVPIEGAGHLVHNDKPRDYLSNVIRFINAKTANDVQ